MRYIDIYSFYVDDFTISPFSFTDNRLPFLCLYLLIHSFHPFVSLFFILSNCFSSFTTNLSHFFSFVCEILFRLTESMCMYSPPCWKTRGNTNRMQIVSYPTILLSLFTSFGNVRGFSSFIKITRCHWLSLPKKVSFFRSIHQRLFTLVKHTTIN